jgi:hypothetical protein
MQGQRGQERGNHAGLFRQSTASGQRRDRAPGKHLPNHRPLQRVLVPLLRAEHHAPPPSALRPNTRADSGVFGFTIRAMTAALGTSSCSSLRALPLSTALNQLIPVILPLGRLRLAILDRRT